MMKRKIRLRLLLYVLLPALFSGVAALVLMKWHVSTRVAFSLTVDRVTFTVGGDAALDLNNPVRFQLITIREFARIKIKPKKLEPMVITGDRAVLTIKTIGIEPGDLGTLYPISVKPNSRITLEVSGKKQVALKMIIGGQRHTGNLSIRGQFKMFPINCEGLPDLPDTASSGEYRATLNDFPGPYIAVEGQEASLVLIPRIPKERTAGLFPKAGIPVTALDFCRKEKRTGKRLRALLEGGEITYPDYPNIEGVKFEATDFLRLDRLGKFHIEEISLKPEYEAIELRLDGKAKYIGIGSTAFSKNVALTWFDILWYNKRLVFFILIVGSVFTTAERLYKLYKEGNRNGAEE